MKLLPASPSDQDVLFDLYAELFRGHIEEIWGWDEEWQITNFRKEWEEFDTDLIVQKDELLGYIQTRTEVDHIFVLIFGIYPRFQSQGIGAKIMNGLKNTAKVADLGIKLNVFRTNQRVVSFYERLGFEIEAETESGVTLFWQNNGEQGSPNS